MAATGQKSAAGQQATMVLLYYTRPRVLQRTLCTQACVKFFEAMPLFTLDHTPLYVIFNPHQSIASGCFSGDGNAGMDTKVLVSCLLLLLYASIHAKAVPVLENTVPSA